MSTMSQLYEVYAVRYASYVRTGSENFLIGGGDPHDGAMSLDYFVWGIVGGGRTYVVDTGFGVTEGGARNRTRLRSPADGLQAVGIDPATVGDVIITHMHYDHGGNLDLFPNATFHIQDREMEFCAGRAMCHGALSRGYALTDVEGMLRRLFAGRVRFHDGDEELAPGLGVHFIGGHTKGTQVVSVATQRGTVVLASDACHHYAHLEHGRIFPVVYNVLDVLEGHNTLRRLASSADHIIPGHDPLVTARYPIARPGLEGIVVRLDVHPTVNVA